MSGTRTSVGRASRRNAISDAVRVRAQRLSPEARRAAIIAEAVKLTAEVGYSWQTRDLAGRLKVAQPLIFKYFPTKQELLDTVFEEVYLRRWNPEWELLLTDRREQFAERLTQFYRSYTSTIFDYTWIRIYLFSGLMGSRHTKRYVNLLETKIISNICKELRNTHSLPQPTPKEKRNEFERVWQIHAGLFYFGVRKFVYQLPITQDVEDVIENTVRLLLNAILPSAGDRQTVEGDERRNSRTFES